MREPLVNMVLTRSQSGDRRDDEERARFLREQARTAGAQRVTTANVVAEQESPSRPGPEASTSRREVRPQSPPIDTTSWREKLDVHLRRLSDRQTKQDTGRDIGGTSGYETEITRRPTAGRDMNVTFVSPANKERRAASIHSQASSATELRKKEAELAAMERLKQLRAEEIRLERELVEKRLEVEKERLDEEARGAGSQDDGSNHGSIQRVDEWLTGVQNAEPRRERERWPQRESQTPVTTRERSSSRGRAIDRLAEQLEAMARPPPRQIYELPIFAGEPSEWLTFYNSYKESTLRYKFTNFENMCRLRHSLKGEARHCVQHMLASSSRPDLIILILKKNFGRTDLLIDRAIEELKRLPPLGPSAIDLNVFATKVMNIVATLVDLDKRNYGANPLLIREITERLSPHLRSRWCIYARDKLSTAESELTLMAEFLLEESDAEMEFSHARAPNKRTVAVAEPRGPRRAPERATTSGGAGGRRPPMNRAYTYAVERSDSCLCCGGNHRTTECRKLLNMHVGARWDWARQNHVCFKCMTCKHRRDQCKMRGCGIQGCPHSHHRLLHMEANTVRRSPAVSREEPEPCVDSYEPAYESAPRAAGSSTATPRAPNNRAAAMYSAAARTSEPRAEARKQVEQEHAFTSNTRDNGRSSVLLKVVPIMVSGPRGEVSTYALLDQGSTVSLIEEGLADAIGAVGKTSRLEIQGVGTMTSSQDSRRVHANVRGGNYGSAHSIALRTVRELGLRTQRAEQGFITQFPHLRDMESACYEEARPQVLIGADNWHLMLPIEVRMGRITEPAALLTPLGWVIFGSAPRTCRGQEVVLHCRIREENDELNKQLKEYFHIDALGISNVDRKSNVLHQRAEQIFEESVKRIDGPRYEVGQLWRDNEPKLPPSYAMAFKRLKNIENKMDRNPDFKEAYTTQVNNLLKKRYAEPAAPETSNRQWYLPHFGVVNPNKPGKLRLVFDAAAQNQGRSLNDFILEGPDKLKSILGILFRFREGAYAVTADIAEMFLQIHMKKEDKQSQLFLWRGEDRTRAPTIYKMNSMIFGAASSPFLAHSVRDKNARDNEKRYPLAVEEITQNHYMDDFVSSFATEEMAIEVSRQVAESHKLGGFELRGWTSNSTTLLQDIPNEQRATGPSTLGGNKEQKILGMMWDPASDELGYNTKMLRVPAEVRNAERVPTKREALSAVMSIYDPLGLISQYVITAKIQLQRLWLLKIDWDEELPANEATEFRTWMQQLNSVAALRVPRRYATGREERRELHIFVDASSQAYAATAYWRIEHKEGIAVNLVAAKSKVAPIKPLSIPRLELQAALIGARLQKAIQEDHRFKNTRTILWTDSRTVLHWVRDDARRYSTYVAHRLAEIAELTEPEQWRWVPTKDNPADDATRADYTRKITNEDRWYKGPKFLWRNEESWPHETVSTQQIEDLEIKENVATIQTSKWEPPLPDISRFSKYDRLIGATARVLQFQEIMKRKHYIELHMGHKRNAEYMWLQHAQRQDFPDEIRKLSRNEEIPRQSRLYKLDPFMDTDGLIKLRGRIDAAPTTINKRPPILDGRNQFVRLYLQKQHERAAHANNERVINDVKQQYWILRLRPTVRTIASKCQQCILRRTQPRVPALGDLPRARMEPYQRPFTYAATDYFGPVWVTIGRRREKRWVALFTCLTTRAVHLEIVHTLSTSSAIMALRRLAARRGWPKMMYSDNATNFRGADIELRAAYKEWLPALKEHGIIEGLEWRFIAPGAPNQGGAWERLVRSVKTALSTTLHTKAPNEEILITLLAEAEQTVNARPLTHVSVDPQDEEALTPNHFLLGGPTAVPPTGPCTEADRRTWRASQALADHFWARWLKEYLPTLAPRQSSASKQEPVKTGDYVIIVDPTLPRNVWPRGIVTATFPGPDGAVRNVEVRTRGGVFRRPASRLAVLPLQPGADTGVRRGETVADS